MDAATSPSVAEQSVELLGGPRSVLVRQRADHAILDELLEEAARTSGTQQDEVLTRLARLVFPHAYAEETVLWPVVRATLPDGEQITLRNEQEHQEINELFSDLDRTPPGPRRDELLRRTAEVLRQDARDEEDLILPRLQAALSGAQLRRLGLTWELVRRTSPTRPHAVVSRRPPGNLLSGLPLSALDRSRVALDRAARGTPALAGPLKAASGALALAAGAVEHLPPLRRGEQPSTSTDRPVRR
jgi:hemerythrin superfamily protein